MYNHNESRSAKRQRVDQDSHIFSNETNKSDNSSKIGPVLFFIISNPKYPITVDVLHKISSPYGTVQRIIIFRENGVQAMVEFEYSVSAMYAKQQLHGVNIYRDCCELDICYAPPKKLTILRNDQDSWDYTKVGENSEIIDEHLLSEPPQRSRNMFEPPQWPRNIFEPPRRLRNLFEPPYEISNERVLNDCYNEEPSVPYPEILDPYPSAVCDQDQYKPDPRLYHPRDHTMVHQWLEDTSASSGSYSGIGRNPNSYYAQQSRYPVFRSLKNKRAPPGFSSSVVIVYNLDDKIINTDQLFNIFCLYGNVVAIRFVLKENCYVFVQMENPRAAKCAFDNLSNVTIGNSSLEFQYSRKGYLDAEKTSPPLEDGSPSFKHYHDNKNNRFLTAENARKCKILPPSSVLFFFRFPPNFTKEKMDAMLEESNVSKSVSFKLVGKPINQHSFSRGLVEFSSISEACMVIMMCNNKVFSQPGKTTTYNLKFAFTEHSEIIRSKQD